jgi:Spy/CpxP family protein refolding chaperone
MHDTPDTVNSISSTVIAVVLGHERSVPLEVCMRKLTIIFLMWIVPLATPCQAASSKYQPGTIMAVERHEDASAGDNKLARYDVSVRIDDTVYVVLYTPPNGANIVERAVGHEFLFRVGENTLRFPERFGGHTELPILATKELPPQPAIDWSKAPGQYFVMKMKNLSTSLNLSDEQQARIKSIAEQESSEAKAVIFTPVVSRKERLSQWEKIVRSADVKMKPILTAEQWGKLQEMRKDQKRELKDLIAKLER